MERKVLLVSMPWPNYNMPSIQVAALKAFLQNNSIECEAEHWFLSIADYLGFKFYNDISLNNGQGGEAIYSYMLFEQNREELLSKNSFLRRLLNDRPEFIEDFIQFHVHLLSSKNWEDFSLVGFTLNFSQNLSSLYMANEIKKRNPSCKIIFGGAEATSELGASLLKNFSQVDYACNGEGETVLVKLYQKLITDDQDIDLHDIGGLIFRNNYEIVINTPNQLSSMESLPTPDYSEYFNFLDAHKTLTSDELSVVLPLETSRGCYYSCSFCSLNIQWTNTRNQLPSKVSIMMSELSSRYHILDFFFVDNITPTNTKQIFTEVLKSRREYRFFYEMRANIPLDNLLTLKAAGLKRVQIGVEALSSSMLRKFNKKSKVIHNIQGMKNCQELGIIVSSNLLIKHPCASEEDINESIRIIDLCYHLRPPTAFSEFGLVYGSPDYNNPREEFSITGNDEMYLDIYPTQYFNSLDLPLKQFQLNRETVDWNILKDSVSQWKSIYGRSREPLLCIHDGEDFLKIVDKRYGNNTVYILEGIEREIYLYIRQIKPISKISSQFESIPHSELLSILREFLEAKLVFSEDDSYLSLALSDISSSANSEYFKVDEVTK